MKWTPKDYAEAVFGLFIALGMLWLLMSKTWDWIKAGRNAHKQATEKAVAAASVQLNAQVEEWKGLAVSRADRILELNHKIGEKDEAIKGLIKVNMGCEEKTEEIVGYNLRLQGEIEKLDRKTAGLEETCRLLRDQIAQEGRVGNVTD